MQHKKISERLKELRKTLKLSQTDFGRKIGKNYHSVMRWELGKVLPPENVIEHIAETFQVDACWLKDGTGSAFEKNDDTFLSERSLPYNADKAIGCLFYSSLTSFLNGSKASEVINMPNIPSGSFAFPSEGKDTPPVTKSDLIICIPAEKASENGLYLINDSYGDNFVRFYSKDESTFFSKRNDYPDADEDKVSVIGKVISLIRQIDF